MVPFRPSRMQAQHRSKIVSPNTVRSNVEASPQCRACIGARYAVKGCVWPATIIDQLAGCTIRLARLQRPTYSRSFSAAVVVLCILVTLSCHVDSSPCHLPTPSPVSVEPTRALAPSSGLVNQTYLSLMLQ